LLIEDFRKLIEKPSRETLKNLAGDASIFIIIPFVGGYLRIEAYIEYLKYKDAYDDNGITEEMLYKDSLLTFKERYLEFIEYLSELP
jgi:hypothetical protein